MTYLSIKEILDILSKEESALVEAYKSEKDSGEKKVSFHKIIMVRDIRQKIKNKIISKYDK